MTYYTSRKKNVKGRTLHDILHQWLLRQMACFQHFAAVSLCIHVEFLNETL